MIRGSIEVAQRTHVSGWIHADTGTVRDRLILAFAGDRCVGAGKVDRFRRDLLEADLGDGYCGFDFPIKLDDEETAASVIVKLQNSDAALIQRGTVLTGAQDEQEGGGPVDLGAIPPARVSWMQDRGWLEQQEYDFLRAVQTIGAYERGLRPARRPNGDNPAMIKPEQIAHDLFSLYALAEVDVSRTMVGSVSDLAHAQSPMHAGGLSVVALWSGERCRIVLDERSHIQPEAGPGSITLRPAPGAIEYGFGPDRMLFVHRRASFAPEGAAPANGIVVFTARERAAAFAGRTVRRRADQAA